MSSAKTPAGYAFTSPSYKMLLRPANNWNDVIETPAGDTRAFGGLSATSGLGGVTSAVYTSVPLSAPLSTMNVVPSTRRSSGVTHERGAQVPRTSRSHALTSIASMRATAAGVTA